VIAGEIVCNPIPLSSTITLDTLLQHTGLTEVFQVIQGLDDDTMFQLSLMKLLSQSKSSALWKSTFGSNFPTDPKLFALPIMDVREGIEADDENEVKAEADELRQEMSENLKEDYEAIIADLHEGMPDVFSLQEFNFDAFLWAAAIMQNLSFTVVSQSAHVRL
jgi:hypothetical protein